MRIINVMGLGIALFQIYCIQLLGSKVFGLVLKWLYNFS